MSCVWDLKSQLFLHRQLLVLLGVASFVSTQGTVTFLPCSWDPATATETAEMSIQPAHNSRKS